jgi:hypothetical protein
VIAAATCAVLFPISAAHAQTVDDEAQDVGDLARLRQALADSHRKNDVRKAGYWTLVGLGGAGMAAVAGFSIYGFSTSPHPQWLSDVILDSMDASAGLVALAAFFKPGNFDGIEATLASASVSESAWSARHRTEGAWAQVAEAEHHNRRLIGWLFTGLGLLLTGGATAAVIAIPQQPDHPSVPGSFIAAVPEGALITIAGLHLLTSDGPVESALHEYELSTGRSVRPQEAFATPLPFVAAMQQGAVFGLGGRF